MNTRTQRRQQPPGKALVGTVEPGRAIAAPVDSSPDGLLAMAISKGADLAYLKELMELKERHDANEARKAFVAAMAEFKLEDLSIGKSKHVSFTTSKGTTSYDHAELHNVCDVIVPALARHGFSHAWAVKQDQARITVTCTLTHRMGHRESVEMTAAPDDSGGKNGIQAIASTKTYLERYTLLAATGLATGGSLGGPNDDDDGRGAGGFEPDGDPRGDMPKEMSEAEKAERRRLQCVDAAKRHAKAVDVIQDEIGKYDLTGDEKHLYTVAEAWREIPEIDQMALWLAPSKGGVLTTHDRDVIKTKLPRTEPSHEG